MILFLKKRAEMMRRFKLNDPIAIDYVLKYINKVASKLTLSYAKIFNFEEEELESEILCKLYDFIKSENWVESKLSYFEFVLMSKGKSYIALKTKSIYNLSWKEFAEYSQIMLKLYDSGCDVEVLMEYDYPLICEIAEMSIEDITSFKSAYKKIHDDFINLDSLYLENESYDTLDTVIISNCSQVILNLLNTLTPREQIVIMERYGFHGIDNITQVKVGLTLGVTTERIRQIEAKALRKLRHPCRSKKIKDFL